MGTLALHYFLSLGLINLLKYIDIHYSSFLYNTVFDIIKETLDISWFNNIKFTETLSERCSLPETFIRYEKSKFIWNEIFELLLLLLIALVIGYIFKIF